jgi:hypothetical protein
MKFVFLILAVVFVSIGCVFGAQVYNETFNSGSAGWTNRGPALFTAADGAIRIDFPIQSVPTPDFGALVASNTASSGFFVGDYPAANIKWVGFRFRADQVLPSALTIRWIGGTSSYFRGFTSLVTETGVWYSCAVSLAGIEEGDWIGNTNENVFQNGLQSVRQLEVQVLRNGTEWQSYYVDDFFIDSMLDTDHDKLADDWELKFYNSLTNMSAYSDHDNDHFYDLYEYLSGTVPTDEFDYLRVNITAYSNKPDEVLISWTSASNIYYSVNRCTNLISGYQPVSSIITGSPPVNLFIDTNIVTTEKYYYRIKIE